MGSRPLPHQGSNKADALSAELQGHQCQWRANVSTSSAEFVNTRFLKSLLLEMKRDRPFEGDLFSTY